MRTLILITLFSVCAACTPKPDTGEDGGCDTGAMEETGLPSTCEARTWYFDADGDGWGIDIPGSSQRACAQPGADWTSRSGDCDDNDADLYPGHGC